MKTNRNRFLFSLPFWTSPNDRLGGSRFEGCVLVFTTKSVIIFDIKENFLVIEFDKNGEVGPIQKIIVTCLLKSKILSVALRL